MVRTTRMFALFSLLGLMLSACQGVSTPPVNVTPADIHFSGEKALATETEFVNLFPNRHSGQPNNEKAAAWLMERYSAMGLACSLDEWEIINYSRPVRLRNVVCKLPGASEKEILVVAHHDQAPTTVQGADNDGSGVAIMLQLTEIFAAEDRLPYTLAFVSTDAEEYGMLGSGRYIQTHPARQNVLVGISLDNLGRTYYSGMDMEVIGQFGGYTPIWLPLTTRAAARAAGAEWDVYLRAPFNQITDQAAPVSLMDEGPIVRAGVPAIGLAGRVPAEFADGHFHMWHDPSDTLVQQSAATLGQSGLIAEALIRQLMTMEEFPRVSGPYLYFDESGQILKGLPLWAIFFGFVAIFMAASLLPRGRRFAELAAGWGRALLHFAALWLPLVAAIVLLYIMVGVGLMDKYHVYPATSKDPLLYHPRWPAVILFLVGLAVLLFVGRKGAARGPQEPSFADVRSLAMLVIALGGLYILAINPFGLLFMVPLLFWLLMRGRKGFGRVVDLLLFLLGGLVVYALVYTFGFIVLRLNWAMLWYLMNMFSIQMISFPMAAVIMAIFAAGLSLIVDVPRKRAS